MDAARTERGGVAEHEPIPVEGWIVELRAMRPLHPAESTQRPSDADEAVAARGAVLERELGFETVELGDLDTNHVGEAARGAVHFAQRLASLFLLGADDGDRSQDEPADSHQSTCA